MIYRAYDNETNGSENEVLRADPSEIPTIDLMVRGISSLEQFSSADMRNWLGIDDRCKVGVTMARRIRNFASYVAHEETFQANCPLHGTGGTLQQKVLCITKRRDSHLQESHGSWTTCMSQSPGFRQISTST